MRFVKISHPKLGTSVVPESRIKHLSDGWKVVEDIPAGTDPTDKRLATSPPRRRSRASKTTTKRAPRARKSTPPKES